MSNFKEQLHAHLKNKMIDVDTILSIGVQSDDRRYFKELKSKEYITLDVDQQFNPDLLHDMNLPIQKSDGDLALDYKWMEYFDVVMALNLWEYIYDPVVAHRNIADLLKPGGTYISNYPFVYGQHPPIGTDYLRYTPDGARKLIQKAGLKIIDEQMIIGNGLIHDFYYADEMRIRKDVDHTVIGITIFAQK